MSLRQRYLTVLASLAPAGAVGMSALLGAAAPAAASEPPSGVQPPAVQKDAISERLAAIREAVSTIDQGKADASKAENRLAWGNWGWGWGWLNWRNWPNWHNWGNWFRNW